MLVGGQLLRALWFPIAYLAVALPPPDTVVSLITQPLKIAISQWAVTLLHALDYPDREFGRDDPDRQLRTARRRRVRRT